MSPVSAVPKPLAGSVTSQPANEQVGEPRTEQVIPRLDGDAWYQYQLDGPVASQPMRPSLPTPVSSHSTNGEKRRWSRWVLAGAMFVLGGLVGVIGFAVGQYVSDNGPTAPTPTADEAIQDAAATVSGAGAMPIPNAVSRKGNEPVAHVARILGPSVVQVETNRGQGSGVVYADGLVLTNHHVVDGASQVQIRTDDGRVIETEIVGSDPRNDIAVLSASEGDLPVASIGSSASLEPGQLTVAIGSPFQLQQTVTAGIVSSVNRPVPNATGGVSAMIQTDAPINPGNSGGALGNRDGELIGINASIRTDGSSNSNVGIGFAVPIDTAIKVAERLVEGGSLEYGVLGVSGNRQDSSVGVPISEVTAGSGADLAGLEVGDRILAIDGAPVTSIGELTSLVQSHFSGDVVELAVQRGADSIELEATLT